MGLPRIPRPAEIPREAGLPVVALALAYGVFSIWYGRLVRPPGIGWAVMIGGCAVACAFAVIGVTVWRSGASSKRA